MGRVSFLLTVAALVAVAGVATIGIHPHWSPDGRATNDALLVGFGLAGAMVALTRYRSTGDTHPLFVGAALLVVVVQTVIFDQLWILSDAASPWEGLSFPSLGWLIGWMIAAAGLGPGPSVVGPARPQAPPGAAGARLGRGSAVDHGRDPERATALPPAGEERGAHRGRGVRPHIRLPLGHGRDRDRPPGDRGVARDEGRGRCALDAPLAGGRLDPGGGRTDRTAGASGFLSPDRGAGGDARRWQRSSWLWWHSLHRNDRRRRGRGGRPTGPRRSWAAARRSPR